MTRLLRSALLYPALCAVWACVLFFRYSDYQYVAPPRETAGYEGKKIDGVSKMGYIRNSLHVLKTRLLVQGKEQDIPYLLANIGTGYYDLYLETGNPKFLDTVIFYLSKSLAAKPDVPRFHYNLGRAFTEVGDHALALYHYEKTVALDPAHVLALSNAGMTAFFVFNRNDLATRYLLQALTQDSLLPTCHLVLGHIYASDNKFAEAVMQYEAEIASSKRRTDPRRYPVLSQNINQAAALSHFNLFALYSKKFRDKNRALSHYNEYLRLEQDSVKKNEALAAFKLYWGKEPG